MNSKRSTNIKNKTGLQPVLKTCGATPLGFSIAVEKNRAGIMRKQTNTQHQIFNEIFKK